MSCMAVFLAAAFVASEGGEELRLFQTTESKDFRELATPGFTIHPYPAVEALDVDAARELHPFLALGASLTDASAWVLANMPAEGRAKLLRELFTPEGCNLGAIRLNIGASDYSTGLYSYDDTPGDVEMKRFSLARDDEFLVPMAKAVKAVRPDVYVFASPWSPPGWMKTSGVMIGGNLRDESMPALANYFVKYVQGYAERGVRIDAVTPQNETMCETGGQYPCCTYPAAQEGAFVRDHLAPAFRKAGVGTEIWVHDHDPNPKGARRVRELLAIPGVRESVGGVAWHCYCSPSDATNMAPVRADYPDLPFYHTENGPHVTLKERTEVWWAKKVFAMLQNGCGMFTSWNLCLDELGTPATGAHLCGGFTVVDSATHEVSYSPQYRLFRHIGPFVKRGARVMEVAGSRDGTELVLFRNPGGEFVLVVACDGTLVRRIQRRRLVVRYKGKYKTLPLPGGQWSVSTLVFK
ncbi:MAG: hypothetical protein IKE55_00110 [Kiritimatiellae bacterium]|nr:hypothetical protein [Kiritimatiellia bacterium]